MDPRPEVRELSPIDVWERFLTAQASIEQLEQDRDALREENATLKRYVTEAQAALDQAYAALDEHRRP